MRNRRVTEQGDLILEFCRQHGMPLSRSYRAEGKLSTLTERGAERPYWILRYGCFRFAFLVVGLFAHRHFLVMQAAHVAIFTVNVIANSDIAR
jgi:hypothetical protein